jgi:DNA-binding NtrC family response regulator
LDDEDGVPGLVGRSEAIRSVARLIRLVAPRRATVLITGRTGTGKELVARAIHAASKRAGGPIVTVNCGAIPENLIEAEFFGHVKGAFTGAVGNRAGRFEQADGGDIFLDEIGEMPLDLQCKLLRVLQEREFERVGSSETVKVDVRVLAATNCDLKDKVERGEFREDLYYRLNVVPVQLPSLAERREDIPLLAEHLIERICGREDLALKRLVPEALARLMEYPWPGNVRQLENAIDSAVARSGERCVLYPSDFPLLEAPRTASIQTSAGLHVPPEGLDFDEVMARMERSLLDQALGRTGGNKKRAADLLRIKRTTFAAKWRSVQERLGVV